MAVHPDITWDDFTQMDGKAGGKIRVDVVEKLQKLLMPVPAVAIADGYTAGHIHGREQGSDAVPFIVVRLSGGHAWRQWQDWLGRV